MNRAQHCLGGGGGGGGPGGGGGSFGSSICQTSGVGLDWAWALPETGPSPAIATPVSIAPTMIRFRVSLMNMPQIVRPARAEYMGQMTYLVSMPQRSRRRVEGEDLNGL
jgi:hypothetical protein